MSASATNPPTGDETYANRRQHERHAVLINATLHAAGKSQPTIINDFSAGGAGLSTAIGVSANDQVEIEFENGRRIEGNVVWWISGCCGVKFNKALDDDDPVLAACSNVGRQ